MSSRALPDPIRAHGAWVYLFASVGAGALVGAARGVEPALLCGTGFAGGYLAAGAWVVGLRRKARQLALGAVLALAAPALALALGARADALAVSAAALPVAVAAVWRARRRGLLSRSAVVLGLAALALAAPAAAVAGGAGPGRAGALFSLLWPFYCWRSLRVAAPLEAGGPWNPAELRERGLREAGIAALWTLLVAGVLRSL